MADSIKPTEFTDHNFKTEVSESKRPSGSIFGRRGVAPAGRLDRL